MHNRHNRELGVVGETLAAQYLERAGMRVVARNWRCPNGELDLIVRGPDFTVVVEVKTRSSQDCGHPFEAITAAKVARLQRLARIWCEQTGARGRLRIDAVAVFAPTDAPAVIEHLEGIG